MSLRCGITTGTCAAAAAKAAATVLVGGSPPHEVELRLPAGETIRVPILYVRSQPDPTAATAAVRKDAGDDPDVTHGLEVRVRLSWDDAPARHSWPARASAPSPNRGSKSRRASRPSIPSRDG